MESIYQKLLDERQLVEDAHQASTVRALQSLYDELEAGRSKDLSVIGRLTTIWTRKSKTNNVKGVYIWGGVGRGKTFLMDLFFSNVPVQQKLRLHFHRFMDEAHTTLRRYREVADPLTLVAKEFANKARVLCFDEFTVNDIGDAMIISGLLEGLFKHNVVLIATSNTAPGSLYKNGLQRERFRPAIRLLQRHMNVIELGGERDHRFEFLQTNDVYNTPIDEASHDWLEHSFLNLATQRNEASWEKIRINGRVIQTIRHTDNIAWFDFKEICGAPRGTSDYIGIARQFNTVLISHVPVFKNNDDQARRFINLVDEFYDRNVKLILSAEASPGALYRDSRLSDEFKRAASRLFEMQSHEYLEKQYHPH